MDFFWSLDVLPVTFNVVFTLSRLSFYGQLCVAQLSALQSPCSVTVLLINTVILWEINDDDDKGEHL